VSRCKLRIYTSSVFLSPVCYSYVSAAIHPNCDARRRGCQGGVQSHRYFPSTWRLTSRVTGAHAPNALNGALLKQSSEQLISTE